MICKLFIIDMLQMSLGAHSLRTGDITNDSPQTYTLCDTTKRYKVAHTLTMY